MFKLVLFLLAIFSCSPHRVTRSDVKNTGYPIKIVRHTNKSKLPDSIKLKGTILNIVHGYCGLICAGASIVVASHDLIPNYPNKNVFIVSPCIDPCIQIGDTIQVKVSKLLFRDRACYYISVFNEIDSEGVPYYKISEFEAALFSRKCED